MPSYHAKVLHQSLSRNLEPLIMDLWDELKITFDEMWGDDSTTAKEIPLMENMTLFSARTANRVFVGAPLCRNQEYTADMIQFSRNAAVNMHILEWVPGLFRPILAPLLCARNSRIYANTAKYTIPVIKQRLANIQHTNLEASAEPKATNDYLSWHIKLARAEQNEVELDPVRISLRMMPLNFAGMHTTSLTITNVLLDILSADPSKRVLEDLQEEVERVYAEHNGVWTKASLNKLIRVDSAIRESMRLHNFSATALVRKVMSPNGLQHLDEGWLAPYGAYIGLDLQSVHHDSKLYPDPNGYDAFRFSRLQEGKNTAMTTTSDTFLSFGHGKRAW